MPHITEQDFDAAIERHFPPRRHDRPLYAPLREVKLAPVGLDQQGRYETRQPEAAHAASEIDDDYGRDDRYPPGAGLVIAIVIVTLIALTALIAHALASLP